MSNKVRILDPFLPEYLHERIKTEIMNVRFPWYFPAYAIDNEPDPYMSCFGITLFDRADEIQAWHHANTLTHAFDYFAYNHSNWFEIGNVMRCRANMYAPGQTTSPHIDNDCEDRWSLLYYVNDADGGTVIDGETYYHKENTAVFFDARLLHQAIRSTSPSRVSVNWIIAGRMKNQTIMI